MAFFETCPNCKSNKLLKSPEWKCELGTLMLIICRDCNYYSLFEKVVKIQKVEKSILSMNKLAGL